ncbi:PEPxxWA-CTERM sorting domain-containing protein [Sphingobium phenoxybenzoativorans]|uniref:PEPxxWA-CTERM sorting domain-containing protein n=1 Tax=Sphingobium phenoxybenzoativorans TaxID=1592790 RepID=UPI000872C143|nr:PEPxxWA-CTERM sorting domain-containing protein [Sphingobium phenoxybenzoativorans]
MKRTLLRFCTLFGLAVMMPANADAYISKGIFTGKLIGGVNEGAFGGGPFSNGTDATISFLFNSSVNVNSTVTDGSTYSNVSGYSLGWGGPAPMTATMSIHGIEQSINLGGFGLRYLDNGGFDEVEFNISELASPSYINMYFFTLGTSAINSLSLQEPVHFKADGNTFSQSEFQFGSEGSGSYAKGYFQMSRFDLTSAVPEPSTWIMMIAGFFGLGIALRRRKTIAADKHSVPSRY